MLEQELGLADGEIPADQIHDVHCTTSKKPWTDWDPETHARRGGPRGPPLPEDSRIYPFLVHGSVALENSAVAPRTPRLGFKYNLTGLHAQKEQGEEYVLGRNWLILIDSISINIQAGWSTSHVGYNQASPSFQKPEKALEQPPRPWHPITWSRNLVANQTEIVVRDDCGGG
ncbi:hypothetical protein H101_05756 [Trichophyton interdigitale H6]|nr:hypothetical protein H101_05756 [Trichophyton interdigitale H6]